MSLRVEIFCEEGIEFTGIGLILEDDGSLRVSGVDMGPQVEAHWGDYDYEYWVTIPAEAVSMLAFRILEDMLIGDRHAVTNACDICKKYGISYEFMTWS